MFALGMSVKQATDIVDHINSTLTYSQHESLARDVLLSNKSVGNLVRSVGVYVCVASRLIRSVGVRVCVSQANVTKAIETLSQAQNTLRSITVIQKNIRGWRVRRLYHRCCGST